MRFNQVCVSLLLLSTGTVQSFNTPLTPKLHRATVTARQQSVIHMSAGDGVTTTNNVIPGVTSTSLNAATLGASSVMEKGSVLNEEQQQLDEFKGEERSNKSYQDDGFVFGLEGSGLERPKGKTASLVVEGDSLETKPYHVAIVSGTFLGMTYFATAAMSQLFASSGGNVELTALQSMAVLAFSWVMADFGSGVFHWSVDNYGNGRTPLIGSVIAAFQGHHSAPWTITQRGFCNNVHKLCYAFGVPTVAAISGLAGPDHPMTTLFFTLFFAMEIMSQELHKWSHMTKGECSPLVNWLQDVGLIIGRKPHAQHHMAPYDGNYCIVNGVCNGPLDQSGFFRRLEHMIYKWNGVESNAWKLDPELRARTLRGEYSLPQKK